MSDELLDIVNEADEVVGQRLRSEIYSDKSRNFRVVNLFIRNDKGALWIPLRSPRKRLFPLAFDASMGGHVAAGESYQQALERELMEELRIDSGLLEPKEIGRMTPHEHGVSAFMKVFLIESNDVPDYNRDDFISFSWLMPDELLQQIHGGVTCKDDLPRMVEHLFL